MTRQKQTYGDTTLPCPSENCIPNEYKQEIHDMFDTWTAVRTRNRILSTYYDMKNRLKDLGISIPKGLLNVNCVVGWCKKAVDARATRSVFDGFTFSGKENNTLNNLVRQNRLRGLYNQACRSMLVHGLAAFTVMKGTETQPSVVIRSYSANQFSCLWDKDTGRIKCGIVCADVDRFGIACKYIAHFAERVLIFEHFGDGGGWQLTSSEENPMGRPLMEVMRHDADLDRPLGHSLITPEIQGIVDKAMRDVLRMEVGAEFFTFPQRYVLGASDTLFSDPPEGCTVDDSGAYVDKDGNEVEPVPNEVKKMRSYLGAIMAISKDENGDIPQVGQFSAGSADNFTRVFENDAQRFSGATNVPLAQLGVLSNNYTSSDALGAANDPLILAVEEMNRENGEVLEELARMVLAIEGNVHPDDLKDTDKSVQAVWKDPSMPTLAARADGWTKLGQADTSIIGTRVWYEMLGLSQGVIERLFAEKEQKSTTDKLNEIGQLLTEQALNNTAETSELQTALEDASKSSEP